MPTTHSLLSSATDVGQAERDGSERFTPFNRPSCSSSAIAAGQAARDGSERTNCVTYNFPNANDSSSLSRGYSQRIRIWSVNVRKLLRRKAELEARLKNAAVDVLMLQETWLADTVEELAIEGYYLVGRLDREAGPKAGYGGVAIYAKTTISCIALLEHSSGAERSWCILHTNIGAILLGNWYRAPDAGESSIDSLATELERLGSEVIGVILTGDINIHHRKWLRHSRDNSTIGERLWNVCKGHGLKQLVSDPTRGPYLLDLVLADIGEFLKVQVLPELADHKVVSIDLDVLVPTCADVPREVWNFRKADWDALKTELKGAEWAKFLVEDEPDLSVQRFCDHLRAACDRHIPRKTISNKPKSHPWIDDECMEVIQAKCTATGTEEFRRREVECAEVLSKKFVSYQQELKDKIQSLPRSSKQWWKLNRELLNRKSKSSTIPPLKARDGKWVLDPEGKADLLAQTFQEKSKLPTSQAQLPAEQGHCLMPQFHLVRTRWVLKIMKALKTDKASGPDKLPARFFHECAAALAVAIAILVRFLLKTRCWPHLWRLHWIHPLYKKGAVSNASNYRGVHLTTVISKIAERAIARVLTPFLDRTGAYGSDQWAFRPKRSCRDLVTLLVSRWLWAMDCGFKVAIYLSDITGAFDRADRDILISKLRTAGLSDALIDFLFSYLAPRNAVVIVQGSESRPFKIQDQVFQGTVLGSPLWNVFFRSVDEPITKRTFQKVKFADDLTAFKNFAGSTKNDAINAELKKVQRDVHAWGVSNRVIFDAGKEYLCILHKMHCAGETFKLLGTLIDPKMVMEDEIRRIRKKTSPKVKAILATRNLYDARAMFQQFKTHVLCLLEQSAGAIYHASETHLASLDSVQTRFVHEMGLSEVDAFLHYNLAPLKLRRDIAVLGLLHKIQLGEAHPDFERLFPKYSDFQPAARTRTAARRHGRQFQEFTGNSYYFNHSMFGAIRIYNLLPAYAVYAKNKDGMDCVHAFQSVLTKDARFKCKLGGVDWISMYCCRKR